MLCLAMAPFQAMADEPPEGDTSDGYEQGKVLVVFDEDATARAAKRSVMAVESVDADAACVASAVSTPGVPVKMAKLDVAEDSTVEEAVAELENRPGVAFAQPNYLYELLDSPDGADAATSPVGLASALVPNVVGTNDPLRYKQWYLSSINAYKSWDIAKAEGKVAVAVLDTGITMSHVDLKDRIIAPYDVVGDARTDGTDSIPDDSPDDESGHGTHVAGIIAAQADNGHGTVGVSYNANVMPLKVCYYSDQANNYITSSEDLASAYAHLLSRAPGDVNGDGSVGTYAQEYNVRVANMSLGALWQPGTSEEEAADKAVTNLVDRAERAGIVTVCAAGNESSDALSWPSDYPACVSVIALDKFDGRAGYSNFGDAKDVSAPGSDMFSTVPLSYAESGTTVRDAEGNLNCYAELSGTSMASPVVAGVFAQVFAANADLTPAEAKDIVYSTAVDLGDAGFDTQFANGKVDAEAAAKAAAGLADPGSDDDDHGKTPGGEEAGGGEPTGPVDGPEGEKTQPGSGDAADMPEKGAEGDSPRADVGTLHVRGLAKRYACTGKPITPELVVVLGDRWLTKDVDYTVSYQDNVQVGTAWITLTLRGNYAGTARLSFQIVAAKASSSSQSSASVALVGGVKAKGAKKRIVVKWRAAASAGANGYQVRYSTKKSMKGAKLKAVKGAAKAKATIKKLKGKRVYYVQVRAYKTAGGAKAFGPWSKVRKAKTR